MRNSNTIGHSNLNPNYHRHNQGSINGVGNNMNMNNGNNVMGNGYNVNGMGYNNFKSGNAGHSRTTSANSVSMAYSSNYSKSSNSYNFLPRPVKRYRIQPPEDKLIHITRPLGYFGYSLQQKDQPEDIINEKTINSGYYCAPVIDIKSETLSSARNDMIDKLKNNKYLSLLGSFAEEIIVEKQKQSHNKSYVNIIKSDNNEANEISNARNMQFANIKQAVSLIILQNLSLFDSIRLIADLKHACKNVLFTDWSHLVMEELIKFPNFALLQQQNQSSSNTSNSDSNQKNSINEQQMIKKWNYCVTLIRYLYIEGLIEPRILMKVLLKKFETSTFQECVLLLPILKEYLNDISRSRALMTDLLKTCLEKLSNIKEEYLNKKIFEYHYINLISLIKQILIATPDVMVKPNTWSSLEKVINKNKYINYNPNNLNSSIKAAYDNLFQTYRQMITKRNILFINNSFDTSLTEKDETENFEEQPISYFENCSNFSDICKLIDLKMSYDNKENDKIIFNDYLPLEKRIFMLCNWAIKFHKKGIYIVSILIKKIIESSDNSEEDLEKLQNILIKYLEKFDIDNKYEYKNLTDLFGELIRNELFFSDLFIRKLIARGYFEKNRRNEKDTKRYLKYLHDFPIFDADKEQLNQRRILLYGVFPSAREKKEIELFNKIKELIKKKLPHVFKCDLSNEKNIKSYYDKPEDYENLAIFDNDEKTYVILKNISSFWKCKLSEWLKDVVYNYIVPDIPIGSDNWWYINPGDSLLNVRQFSTIVQILETIGDKNSIIELCLWLIPKIKKRTMYHYIISCIKKNMILITLNGRQKELFDIVWNKHNKLKSENNIDRILLLFLKSFHSTPGFEIEKEILEQIENDLKIEHKEYNNYEDVITTFEKTISSIKDYNTISSSDLLLLQCKYQHNVTELKKYFKYILEVKFDKEYSKLNKNQIIYNFDIFTEILRQFNNGFDDFNDVIFEYLSEGYFKDALINLNNNQQISYQGNSSMKYLNFKLQNYFFVLLFTSGGCSILRLLEEYFKPVLQLFKDHLYNGKSINENSIILFDNVLTLMHIIFTVDDSKSVIDDLYLTTKIIHYLRSRRVNALVKGEAYTTCLDIFQLTITILSELFNKSQSSLAKQFIPKIKLFLKDWIKAPWFFSVNLFNIGYMQKQIFAINNITHEGSIRAINHLLTLYTLNMINQGISFSKGKTIESPILDINTYENKIDLNSIDVKVWEEFFKSIYSLYKNWSPNVCKVALTLIINNLWNSNNVVSPLTKGFILASLSTLTEISNHHNLSQEAMIEDECISQKDILGYVCLFKPKFNVEVARVIIKSFYLNEDYDNPLAVCIEKKNELSLDSVIQYSDFLSAIVHNITIVKKNFDPTNSNNANHMLGISEEIKYSIIQNLLNHFQWYDDNKNLFDIMEDYQLLYDEAQYIIENDFVDEISIFNKRKLLQPLALEPMEESRKHLYIDIFRSNIFFMLKVLQPLLTSICNRPKEGNLSAWIKVLIHLLSSRIIHGNGVQMQLFEYTLDIVTFLLDDKKETPEEFKKNQFVLLQEIQKEIDIPPILASRINQILPIRIQNIYEFNLSISGNDNSKLISSNIINPWDWFRETKPNFTENNGDGKEDKSNGLVLKSVPVSSIRLQRDKIYPLSFFDMNKYRKQEKGAPTTYESQFDDFSFSEDDMKLIRSLNASLNLEKITPPIRSTTTFSPINNNTTVNRMGTPNGYNSFIDDKIIKPLNMQYNSFHNILNPSTMTKPNTMIPDSTIPLKRKSFQ